MPDDLTLSDKNSRIHEFAHRKNESEKMKVTVKFRAILLALLLA